MWLATFREHPAIKPYREEATPVGFEPAQGDSVSLASRRPNRPAEASLVDTQIEIRVEFKG